MQPVVERFKETYGRLNAHSLELSSELYSDDVEFQDPFHHLSGLPALRRYFAELYAQVESCTFAFEEEVRQGDRAVLMWTMSLRHPKLMEESW